MNQSHISSGGVTKLQRNSIFKPVFKRGAVGTARIQNAMDFPKDGLLTGNRIFFRESEDCPHGIKLRDAAMRLNLNFTRFYQSNLLTIEDVPDYETYNQARPRVPIMGNDFFILNEDRLESARQAVLQPNQDNIFVSQRWAGITDIPAMLVLKVMMCQDKVERQFISDLHWLDAIDAEMEQSNRSYLSSASIRRFHVAPLFDWSVFSIPRLEVYWDMHCDDAERMIERLKPAITRLTPTGGERNYPSDNNKDGNAAILRLHRSKSVYFSIYAKTKKRIRFEVVYHRNLNSIFQRQRTADTTLYQLIDMALDDAKAKLTDFVNDLRVDDVTPASQNKAVSLAVFMEKLQDVFAGNYAGIRHFLTTISRFGSITAPARESQLYERLADQGILHLIHRRKGSAKRIYTFTDQYQWVLQAMMHTTTPPVNR